MELETASLVLLLHAERERNAYRKDASTDPKPGRASILLPRDLLHNHPKPH